MGSPEVSLFVWTCYSLDSFFFLIRFVVGTWDYPSSHWMGGRITPQTGPRCSPPCRFVKTKDNLCSGAGRFYLNTSDCDVWDAFTSLNVQPIYLHIKVWENYILHNTRLVNMGLHGWARSKKNKQTKKKLDLMLSLIHQIHNRLGSCQSQDAADAFHSTSTGTIPIKYRAGPLLETLASINKDPLCTTQSSFFVFFFVFLSSSFFLPPSVCSQISNK